MMVYFQLERIIPTDVRIKDLCRYYTYNDTVR